MHAFSILPASLLFLGLACSTEKSDLRTRPVETNKAGANASRAETQRSTAAANQKQDQEEGSANSQNRSELALLPAYCKYTEVMTSFSCLKCQARELPGYICSEAASLEQVKSSCRYDKGEEKISCDLDGKQKVLDLKMMFHPERVFAFYTRVQKIIVTQVSAVVPSQKAREDFVDLMEFPAKHAKELLEGNIDDSLIKELVEIVNRFDPKFREDPALSQEMAERYTVLAKKYVAIFLRGEISETSVVKETISMLIDGLPAEHALMRLLGGKEMAVKIISMGMGE